MNLEKMLPRRPSGQTWTTFVRNHISDMRAYDFLQTYDLCFRMILVFVIIELASLKGIRINVTHSPMDTWVAQQLCEICESI